MTARYTREMFRQELDRLDGLYDPVKVAKITSSILFRYRADIDSDLEEKMLDIITMEDGPEFEMTEQEFRNFLNTL